jgi:hypothetical protein
MGRGREGRGGRGGKEAMGMGKLVPASQEPAHIFPHSPLAPSLCPAGLDSR